LWVVCCVHAERDRHLDGLLCLRCHRHWLRVDGLVLRSVVDGLRRRRCRRRRGRVDGLQLDVAEHATVRALGRYHAVGGVAAALQQIDGVGLPVGLQLRHAQAVDVGVIEIHEVAR